MAGIGFELKKLFTRRELAYRLRAYAISSIVTVGPMLACMMMIIGAQLVMKAWEGPLSERELLFGGAVYAFVCSYIIVSIYQMMTTRAVSDMLYEQRYEQILPSVYAGLIWSLTPALLIGGAFVIWAPLSFGYKLALYLFFVQLVVIWHLGVYVTALKHYGYVFGAFAVGGIVGTLNCVLWPFITGSLSAAAMLWMLNIGICCTLLGLAYAVERQFGGRLPSTKGATGTIDATSATGATSAAGVTRKGDLSADKRLSDEARSYSLVQWMRRYPSLMGIGFMMALGLYTHQIVQWIKNEGIWVEGVFRMSPAYDLPVYYAFLTTIPTLVLFVVALETSFYPKCRQYYETVLGQGSMREIEQARRDMSQVLVYEVSLLMGIQLFFTILSIAFAVRLLPFFGFTSTMIEAFNILALSFFAYTLFMVIVLVLLYFDDRKGVFALSAIMLACSATFSILFDNVDTSFAMFTASFIALTLSLGRLRYVIRHLHYYTFSAQPIVIKRTPL
ncbi:exopolysaccharide Pel transporter PelG [Paenibacillus sp. 481]|uniref:exopolysaccharide Pel transporter PelG n=1 Tax=Paenibacillus sp. 481 TaxID=2835869 RepID=UPI001E40A602|nr:exopolysaccharide Pel transporter PelG [Paenibacillus sp. 481]UHA75198.1 exopolysaccharide Pel transporter PelG [Paenibacillus sp. 481]